MSKNAVRFFPFKISATLAAMLASGCWIPDSAPTNVSAKVSRCDCGCGQEACRCSSCPVASLRTAKTDDPSAGRAPQITPTVTPQKQLETRRTIYVYNLPGSNVVLDKIRFDLGRDFDLRVNTDSSTFPAWLIAQAKQPGWSYPLLHWRTLTESGKVMVWAGADAFHAQDGGAVKKKQQGLALAQHAQPDRRSNSGRSVETACSYPVRGSWWTHPGQRLNKADLIAHLQSGFHGGKFRLAYLQSLSPEELESLHSDDHEGRVRSVAKW